jgi:hypothetical protein
MESIGIFTKGPPKVIAKKIRLPPNYQQGQLVRNQVATQFPTWPTCEQSSDHLITNKGN